MKGRMLSWSVCMLVSGAAGARAQVPAESLADPATETAAASAEDMGYALGFQIGQQILADQKQMGSPVDSRMLAAGIADAISAAKPRLDEARFRAAMASLEAVMRRKQQDMVEKMRAVAAANLSKGSDYLKKKAAEPGVKSLPSGLLYEVLHEGAGTQPALDHVVVARYVGRHIDGTQFDGTDPSGPPAEFPLRGVVPGWQEALPLMKAGSKWRIHLPPALGYGDEGSPPAITPNEVLVFEIELLESRAGNTAK
ncbi:MAG: FKBP-type peptidyl-prolyl cis-trans isomerase [Planctomycetaceae bacterium]